MPHPRKLKLYAYVSDSLETKGWSWYAHHIQKIQYFLQIIKCKNWRCCKRLTGFYFTVTSDCFLSPPIPLSHFSEGGLQVPNAPDHKNHKFPSLLIGRAMNFNEVVAHLSMVCKLLPYDFFCTSEQSLLQNCFCKI